MMRVQSYNTACCTNTSTSRSTSTSTSTNNGPAKRRRIAIETTKTMTKSVQFNEDIITAMHIIDRQDNVESTTTSWLDLKEYSEIRNGISRSLDLVNFGAPSIMYCVRGLEECCTEYKGNFGCLKSSTIHRRQCAVRAVLYEQELQRHYMEATKATKAQTDYNIQRIRKVSESCTCSNVQHSISMGRIDSEEALLIYIEQPQQQHQQCTKRTTSNAAQYEYMCKQQSHAHAPANNGTNTPIMTSGNKTNLFQLNHNEEKIWNFKIKSRNCLDAPLQQHYISHESYLN
jgi:hypothetical protein